MTTRLIARGRHISTVALICGAAAFLVLADALAVRGQSDSTIRTIALAVAMLGGFVLGTALLRGIGSLVAQIRIRSAMRAHRTYAAEQVHAEAVRGISQLERYLAEQHSRGA